MAWLWTNHLILFALNIFGSYMKEVIEGLDDPKPWVKLLVGSTESNQVRGVWRRHLSPVANERNQPSKVGMQERLKVHMPHSLLLQGHLPSVTELASSILLSIFWFVFTGHCSYLLVCVYLLRVIILYPETYSVKVAAIQIQEKNQSEHSSGKLQNCFQFT